MSRVSKTILIAGGTGYIGRNLESRLKKKGHQVIILSRYKRNKSEITWEEVQKEGLPDCDSIINLSGANIIQKRWTEDRKKVLYDSRIGMTQILVDKIKSSDQKIMNFVSASAIGVYPPSVGEQNYNENSELPPYSDALPFAQKLCRDWEKVVFDAEESFKAYSHLSDIKLNIVRIGLVMSPDGGFMKELIPVYKLFLGGRVGSGLQPYPWIHLHDAVSIFEELVVGDNATPPRQLEVLNAVAPGCVTQKEFSRALATCLHRPDFFWTPSWLMRLAFQERADLLLKGTWVRPVNTLLTLPRFQFEYPTLKKALAYYYPTNDNSPPYSTPESMINSK